MFTQRKVNISGLHLYTKWGNIFNLDVHTQGSKSSNLNVRIKGGMNFNEFTKGDNNYYLFVLRIVSVFGVIRMCPWQMAGWRSTSFSNTW